MNQSIISAARAIIAQQQRVDTIAGNIANINTNGYKNMRIDFKDALYQTMLDPAGGNGNLQKGHGVMLSATSRSFKPGSMVETQRALDFCLDGESFFAVKNPQGETLYTRDGSFAASSNGDGSYLVNGQGYFVLDDKGQKIKVIGNVSDISVGDDGTISFMPIAKEGDPAPPAPSTVKLGIFNFKNPQGLNALGGNLYEKTEASGEPQAEKDPFVAQGYLESSNVDLTVEMTRLIRAQRAFSLASKALTTADGMDGMVNQMR